MKRSLVLGLAFAAAGALVALFGGMQPSDAKPAPVATPSAKPSALPTATPEPPDKAIPRLLQAIKKNPNDKQSLAELAQQYIGVGRPDLTLPLTQKLLALGDRSAQTYYFDGYANEQLNRIPQAIADYENASNVDPTNVGVLGSLTSMYLKTHRFTDAERVAKRSATFNKTDRRSFINLGLVYASEKKFSDAREQFETAYKMDSSDVTPLLQIGQTYLGANDNAGALAAINRAIAADPKNPDAQLFKADLYAKQHDVVNALAAYELAVGDAPDDEARAQIAVREAAFLAIEKKNSDAETAFVRAIATYPNSLQPHLAFGDYWNSRNQIQKAVDQWNLALGPNKDNPGALVRLATYNMRSGHPAQALPYLKSLAQADPNPQVLAMLGQAYTSLHDYSNAKRACQATYQTQPNPDSLGCIAGADFELKNYKESAQIFDVLDSRVHAYLDQAPQLLFIAAKVYENQKQPAKAVVEYKRLLKIMKPGTPDYRKIQASIASLTLAKPAKKHG